MNAAQQALPSKRSTSLRPTLDTMDTGASIATSAATGPAQASQSGAAGGLFGALQGAKGHGPMAGFEALLAAFFGQQGQDATPGQATGGPASLQGKLASALKSDNKAGQATMDDALITTPVSGDKADDKTLDDKPAIDAGPAVALSADAQALAALFAAPLAKPETQPETTAQAPGEGVGGKTSQMAQAAAQAFHAKAQTFTEALETPASDVAANVTDDSAKSAAPSDATGKAELIELAQALTAGQNPNRGSAAARPADNAAPAYAPPVGAPSELAAAVAAAKAQTQTQTDAASAADAAIDATTKVDASVLTEVAAVETPIAPPPAPAKDRFGARPSRLEAQKDVATQSAPLASTAPAAVKPAAPFASFSSAIDPPDAAPDQVEPDERPLKVEASDDAAQAAAAPVSTHATPEAAQAATVAVRGAPETVASLAAQIIKKAEGRATRFDVELHPADLGRVDVRLEIGAHGRLTASMSFENPQAAAELRGRADELQRALESAGFDLSGGLSFDVAGDRGQGQNQARQDTQDMGGGALRGRAFDAALATAGETATAALAGALSAYQGRLTPGLDIRI
jgi:flagellar hook-length control protein FliK